MSGNDGKIDDVRPYGGLVQVQTAGDPELAMSYRLDGLRLLGKLLNTTALASRQDDGPGGFHQLVRMQPDGTRLSAITNNGQHIVRIETPEPPRESEAGTHSAHVSTPPQSEHQHHNVEGGFKDPPLPWPPMPQHKHEGEEEEEKKDGYEYMWVGARYTSQNVPFDVLAAMMIEPDSAPLFRDSELPKRGIVDNINWWGINALAVKQGDDGEWSLDTEPYGVFPDVDSAIQDLYDSWYGNFGGPGGEFDRAENHIVLGTHAIEVEVNNDDDGRFLISANGLRCESIYQWQPGMNDQWVGYDPYATDQTGAAVRNVGDRQLGDYFRDAPNVLWDVVFTLDPYEDLQDTPCDDRPAMLGARRALEREAGMVTQILPGDYILALHAMDTMPQLRSNRAGQQIPLYQSDQSGLAYRSTFSDYDEYMKPVDTTTNLGVEIEVRLGKGNRETVYNFSTTIPESSYDNWVNYPYGMDWWEPCDPDGGPNPAGLNFAPQYLAINPLAGTAEWVNHDKVDLYPILGGGHYSHPGDTRVPLFIYIHVVPWSQPSDEHWAENAGRALFKVLEAATAGVYGASMMSDPGGEGGCVAIFEGTSKSMLWKYNAMSQALEAVPVVSEVDDYPYGWQEDPNSPNGGFQSPYEMTMYWYYPYKYIERNNCNNSIGIAITAVYDSFSFDHGQHRYFADPPDTGDCC
jgi:hypothetical protein